MRATLLVPIAGLFSAPLIWPMSPLVSKSAQLDSAHINPTATLANRRTFEPAELAKIALPLRIPSESWQAARRRIAIEPAAKAWTARREKSVRDWMKRPPDQARYLCGWAHDYIDFATGKPRVWHPEDPEPAQTPEFAKVHGAWVYYLRSTNIDVAKEAAQIFALNKSDDLKDFAARQLDFYADNYSRWPEQNFRGKSKMLGQSLDEAVAAFSLLDTARLIGPFVSQGQRERWNTSLFRPLMNNLLRSNEGSNNVSVWQASATAAIALHLGDKVAWHAALYGNNGINSVLARGLLEDDSWFEPSLRYTAYTIQALANLFLWVGLTHPESSVELPRHITQVMLAGLMRQRFADGTLPAMGDTPTGTLAFDPALLSMTQRTMPVRAGYMPFSWGVLVDPEPALAPPPLENGNILMPGEQAALMRNENWEAFFHYGQRAASHAQADALSFELRYKGKTIASAPGVASYGSRLFLNYLRLGPAHSAPIIDGTGQTEPKPGMLLSHSSSETTAQQRDFANGADVTRHLTVQKSFFRDDTIFSGHLDRASTGVAFHTPCAVGAQGFQASTTPLGLGEFWKGSRQKISPGLITLSLNCDSARLTISFASDKPGMLYVSAGPSETGDLTRQAIVLLTEGARHITTEVRPER